MFMIYTAIGIFTVAAILGIYLLSLVLRKKETPKAVAIVHGLLAATALIVLLVHTIRTGADLVQSITFFVIAALLGIIVFVRDITGKSLPRTLAVFHGLVAITGFIFLLVYTVNRQG